MSNPASSEDKYSPEAIRSEISQEAARIRQWADEQGYQEGREYRIVEDVKTVVPEGEKVKPHEQKAFYMAIHEDQYIAFRDYFTGEYEKIRQRENFNAKIKLNYSWGGRFLVDSDTVPCDTVPVTNINPLELPTKHQEFKQFFRERTGMDFPTAEQLNPILKEISDKGLDYYRDALAKMQAIDAAGTLPDDAYGLKDDLQGKIIEVLEHAQKGEALQELPEMLTGPMEPKLREYADLTYNADDMRNLDRVHEVTGVLIPDELRIDKILERLGIDRMQMDKMCQEFSERRFLTHTE